jgi:hypothetical protein
VTDIDAAFIQISPPNESGFASFGVSVDVARFAMEHASLIVGEINEHTPRTHGDTVVHVNDFSHLIYSTDPPIYFTRWPVDRAFDRVARNVAAVIEDGSCVAFFIGPSSNHWPGISRAKGLGVHSLMRRTPSWTS